MGSSFSSASDDAASTVIGKEYGFRVHRVERNSPGESAGLQSILDYIVVANGVRLDRDDGEFVRMIAESKDTPMRLVVFDTQTLRTRETVLMPNDAWGGSGLLGITIRFDVAQSLSKHTLHILEVFDDSPASAAGLDAYNDYIVGEPWPPQFSMPAPPRIALRAQYHAKHAPLPCWSCCAQGVRCVAWRVAACSSTGVGDLLFDGPDEFGELIMHNERRPVRLYVYSNRTQNVREVSRADAAVRTRGRPVLAYATVVAVCVPSPHRHTRAGYHHA